MGRHGRSGWVSGFLNAAVFVVVLCVLWLAACSAIPSPSPIGEQLSNFDRFPASEDGRDIVPPPPPHDSHWASPHHGPPPSCPKSPASADHFLLVVSTIDGSLSAMDMRTSGDLLWSVKPDERPLLSSSITNIQVTKDGVSTRLIPSLDGGLYEFDGEDIKALPMTAESLLSSSLRITDNSVMVGGKEVGSYGVDVRTGELSYQCTAAGCKDTMEAANNGGDMLLITRNMQTVRAVDVNSGIEKWNFSVGQHEMLFVRSQKEHPGIEHDNDSAMDHSDDDDDVIIDSCMPVDEDEVLLEESELKQLIKVVVSDGLIVGLNPEDPTQMAWSRKFSSPVAKAWILHRGKLEGISLFDSKVVPSLSSSQHHLHHHRNTEGDPLLYVGTHKRQLYVQKEEPDSCEKELPWLMKDQRPETAPDTIGHLPRVTWRPYIIRSKTHIDDDVMLIPAESQTPLFLGNEQPQTPLLGQGGLEHDAPEDSSPATSLTVWHENYPFDMGYYLYPKRVPQPLNLDLEDPAEESIIYVLNASLWVWWKEVLLISLTVSVAVHLILTYLIYRPSKLLVQVDSGASLDKKDSSGSMVSNDSYPTMPEERPPTAQEFKSRFADEFECMEQLGKGGYGVVFRARNTVDEQEYAVKRIALPNRDGAVKKKMLREVRTLAMLDHVGIVRYFHSWIEDPPPGWQEERDRAFSQAMGASEGLGPTTTDVTIPSTEPPSLSASPHPTNSPGPPGSRRTTTKGKQQPSSVLDDIMPFRPENWEAASFGAHNDRTDVTGNTSGEFSLHSHLEQSTDESGSFSLPGGEGELLRERAPRGEGEEEESRDSLNIVFQNPEDAESSSEPQVRGDPVLPFSHYASRNSGCGGSSSFYRGVQSEEDSSSVVFEDSLGGGTHHKDLSQTSSIAFEDSHGGKQYKDISGSSSIVFEEDSHSNREHKDMSESSSIVFEEDSRGGKASQELSKSSSIVFEDSRSRRNRNRDTSQSSSIVFENSHSGGKDHKHSHTELSRAAVLSDSSYGGSIDDNESGDSHKNVKGDNDNESKSSNYHPVVDFTLNSHRGEGDGCKEEQEDKEEDNRAANGGVKETEGREVKEVVKASSGGEGEKKQRLYLYLQMQLCRLETLKDWLISNTLNRERMQILDIFEQIVSAVDYVHTKGLIHRDLKPSNIFFALDNTVKVGDFGLVTAPDDSQGDNCEQPLLNKTSAKHTAEVGTQLYMSPEQIQKKPYDQKVDIFSLGLILLELLMPFSTGMERVTTLTKARKGVFPDRFLRELPVESALVRQLTSARPEKRPTALEILEHSLLQDLNPHPRRSYSRYRTISSCSNNSDPALISTT